MLGYPNLPGIFHSNLRAYVNESVMILPPNIPTFAEVFQQDTNQQYRTLFLGKWHNGNNPDFQAITRGFDEKLAVNIISSYLPIGHPDSVDCALNDMLDRYLRANIRYQVEKDYGPFFEPEGYLTDYLGDQAVRAIEANKENPFLMFLSFTAPHTPLQALQSDYDSLEQFTDLSHCEKVYGSMLISLDRAIGNVLNALERLQLSNNTLVIFSSDNGSPSYINLRDTNKPYRGWKASHFEGGIKVPLMMKWPNNIPAGTVIEDMVSHVDIFPTMLAAASLPSLRQNQVDGVNLLDLIHKRNHSPDQPTPPEVIDNSQAHEYLFWRSGHVTTLRTAAWKIQVAARPNKIWLFHLKDDPTEKVNLANHPDYRSDLNRMLEKLHLVNSSHLPPRWPALSESPVLIDKIFRDPYVEGDEYVYWPN